MSKLTWKPFKRQSGEIQENLHSCMDRVEKEVDLAEKEEAHAERERAQDDRSFRWNTLSGHTKKSKIFLITIAKLRWISG